MGVAWLLPWPPVVCACIGGDAVSATMTMPANIPVFTCVPQSLIRTWVRRAERAGAHALRSGAQSGEAAGGQEGAVECAPERSKRSGERPPADTQGEASPRSVGATPSVPAASLTGRDRLPQPSDCWNPGNAAGPVAVVTDARCGIPAASADAEAQGSYCTEGYGPVIEASDLADIWLSCGLLCRDPELGRQRQQHAEAQHQQPCARAIPPAGAGVTLLRRSGARAALRSVHACAGRLYGGAGHRCACGFLIRTERRSGGIEGGSLVVGSAGIDVILEEADVHDTLRVQR